MRLRIDLFSAITLALFAGIGLAATAEGSVQRQMYCLDPDSEFPVFCDEEDEDDARAAGVRQLVSWRQRPGATP